MQNIEQDDFKSKMNDDNVVILDVRTPDEVSEGHVKGMVHHDIFDQDNFLQFLDNLDRDKKYFVYCRSGNRSMQACMIMDQMGFTDTNNLVGGMNAWTGELEK